MPQDDSDATVPVPPSEAKEKARAIPDEMVDQLLAGYQKPEDLLGPDGLIKQLIGRLISRAMNAEMTHHLGYESGQGPPAGQSNRRNGKSSKTVRSDLGEIGIEVPRDRQGTFEPLIVGKHERHFDGFDDKILSMYARGMSVRDIRAHLQEIYGVEVSPELISQVTDGILDEIREWQARPLEAVYFVVYLDALMVKIRDGGIVRKKAIYTVVGVGSGGRKDVLGLWIQRNEGAAFWLSILTELRQRGVEDIFILCADGLKGLPEAAEAQFPQAIFQTCIVHMIRSSTRFVPWQERKAVCADLRAIYTAPSVEAADEALRSFEAQRGRRFPMIGAAWRRRWEEITPFLSFPAEIRNIIYTTNTIEALHRQLRKVLKTKAVLPDDESALKLIFLAARNATSWRGPVAGWAQALLQFAILFKSRMPE
jgi:putative transposase